MEKIEGVSRETYEPELMDVCTRFHVKPTFKPPDGKREVVGEGLFVDLCLFSPGPLAGQRSE